MTQTMFVAGAYYRIKRLGTAYTTVVQAVRVIPNWVLCKFESGEEEWLLMNAVEDGQFSFERQEEDKC